MSSKKSASAIGVMGQIRAAFSKPASLMIGVLLGAFPPIATYMIAHITTSLWSLQALLVLGGLVFSAKTVWQWAYMAFDCGYKATGFVLLIEGVMITANNPWLSYAALAYLVAINAVANGCSIALRDKGNPTVKKPAKSRADNTNAAPRQGRTRVKLAA